MASESMLAGDHGSGVDSFPIFFGVGPLCVGGSPFPHSSHAFPKLPKPLIAHQDGGAMLEPTLRRLLNESVKERKGMLIQRAPRQGCAS